MVKKLGTLVFSVFLLSDLTHTLELLDTPSPPPKTIWKKITFVQLNRKDRGKGDHKMIGDKY